MTGTGQHEDSTTLRVQPCRTAAVVGYIMYVRVASPRYATASYFCRRLLSVTPLYRIFRLCCRCVGVLLSCRPAAVQPPSSSSLQLYKRVAAVVVADCFDRSVPFDTPPNTHISAVLPLRAHVHSMSIDRANLGGNIGTFLIVFYTNSSLHLSLQRQYFYVHNRGNVSCRRFCPHHK